MRHWRIVTLTPARVLHELEKAGEFVELGRRDVGAAFPCVSRRQAVVKLDSTGVLTLVSHGRGPTGYRSCLGGDWRWLKANEMAFLHSGDKIALDRHCQDGGGVLTIMTSGHGAAAASSAAHEAACASSSISMASASVSTPPPLVPGALVWYTGSSGDRTLVTVASAHFDDGEPYYSVVLSNGRERSVEWSRLTPQADPFSLLSVGDLAIVLNKTQARDNGWFIAARLQRCCKALRDAVAAWREGVTELAFEACDELDDAGLCRIGATCGSRELRAIQVSNCARVTDASIAKLVAFSPALRRLSLSECHSACEDSLRAVADGPCARTLEHLDLHSCRYGTKAGVLALVGEAHNLQHLDLSFCAFALTDAVLAAIAASPMPLLQSLLLKAASAADSRALSDEGIGVLAESPSGKSLTHLDLTYACRLTDEGLRALATHCRLLAALELHGCNRVGDAGVLALGSHCAQLARLDLTQLQLTASGLCHLVRGCPALSTLVVDHCRSLSEEGWARVACEAPLSLSYLSAVNAGGLTDESLCRLVEGCAPLALRSLRLGPAFMHPEVTTAVASELREKWCSLLTISGGPQADQDKGRKRPR